MPGGRPLATEPVGSDHLKSVIMQTLDLNFSFDKPEPEAHVYISRRKGDWIIFVCPECEGHERRLNWRTGQMKVIGSNEFRHQGIHYPTGVDPNLFSAN